MGGAAPLVAGREGLQDPQLIHLRTADGVLSTCRDLPQRPLRLRHPLRGRRRERHDEPHRAGAGRLERLSGRIDYAADWRPRFADAYRIELQAWVDSVLAGEPTPLATGRDGVAASAVAEAVITSMHEGGRVTKVDEP